MQATAAKKTNTHGLSIAAQIEELQTDIRNNPGKVEYRIHLSQLLMVMGDWKKALQQLQTAAQLDNKASAMAQTYRALIQAEIHREQIFNGQRDPQYFGKPQDWQILLAEAIVARTHQQTAAADKLQQQAYDDAPTDIFSLNDTTVNWIADGDSRLGPVCEIFINGSYYWIPFSQLQKITLDAPQDLRDLVWIPSTITLADFSQHVGFLPSRYVFSYAQNNDQLSLASLTEWNTLSEHCWAGMGQKMFISEQGEHPLLAIRTLSKSVSE